MKIKEHLLSGIQGFAIGAIAMAYICNYNRKQLPIAMLFIVVSILSRIKSED